MATDHFDVAALIAAQARLPDLAACVAWSASAADHVARWPQVELMLESRVAECKQSVTAAVAAGRSRPWYRRWLATPQHREAKAVLKQAQTALQQTQAQMARLNALMRVTPASDADRRALIGELKAQRKEAQLRVKDLSLAMREIRSGARGASVSAGTVQAVLGVKGYAANQRKAIAASRESKLRPLEAKKVQEERAIVELDREIARYESL